MSSLGIKSFWSYTDPLNESVQAAKEYLLKRGAEKLKKEKKDLTPEEQKSILSSPEWIEVRDMTQKNPGYAPLFVRFAVEQKAPKDILETTLEAILRNKDRLKDLPREISAYGEIKPSKKDQRPGYDVLIDDLLIVEKKAKLKKFYNSLQTKMKEAFENATPEQIDQLTEISNELDGLKTKEGKDPWQTFRATLGRYENDRGYYPQFNNINFAFDTLIEDAQEFVENWKMDVDEYIEGLNSLKPQLDILYYKNEILALSTRTPDAQREVQGVLSWCLKYDSHFWSYVAGDRVQLVIMDSKRSQSDTSRSIGVTVEKDLKIHAAYNSKNQSIQKPGGGSYKTLQELLKGLDYPESLIRTLERKVPEESKIKRALMLFYKKEETQTPLEICRSLISLNTGFLKGQFLEQDWEKISADVSQIIFEVRKLEKKDFLKQFKASGILTDGAWNVWDRLIGKDHSKEDFQQIYEVSKLVLSQMKDLLELHKQKPSGYFKNIDAARLEQMESLVSNEENIMKEFQKRM